jgi:molecular chaperone DnaK
VAEWVLAVDFGTTSTAAALRAGGRVERVELDGAARMPSMVFWREGTGGSGTGRLVLGEEADELAGLAPWCLERTPKRHIGDEFIRLGEREFRVVDVIGAILRRVGEEAISLRGGEPPREVRLTHPARWGQASLQKLARAADLAGFDEPVFVPEPVAAATHFASERLAEGGYVAVYDLGGGTFDCAVLRRTGDSFELAGPPGGDENLGGEDFDDRLYRFLGRQLSGEKWRMLRESSERAWTQANRELLRGARRCKEILSRSPEFEFYMPPPIDQELLATAESFRELIIADIQRTVGELERTIHAANVDPTQLQAIYLAGGSSRIPLIAHTITERLGQPPETYDDPKLVTVLGAATTDAASRTSTQPQAPAAAVATVLAAPAGATELSPATKDTELSPATKDTELAATEDTELAPTARQPAARTVPRTPTEPQPHETAPAGIAPARAGGAGGGGAGGGVPIASGASSARSGASSGDPPPSGSSRLRSRRWAPAALAGVAGAIAGLAVLGLYWGGVFNSGGTVNRPSHGRAGPGPVRTTTVVVTSPTTSTPTVTLSNTTPTPTPPPPDTRTYNGRAFSIAYPADWILKDAEQSHGSYTDTTFVSPSNSQTLLRVDVTPHPPSADPVADAGPVIAALERDSSYRKLLLRKGKFEGFPALYWAFSNVESGVPLVKVDVFFTDSAGAAVAILSQAPTSAYRSLEKKFSRLVNTFSG